MKTPRTLSPITLAITQKQSQRFNCLLIVACLMFSSASVFAGVQDITNTETITYKANQYTIEDTSLWSANGPGSLQVDWSLSEQQWDKLFGKPPRARLQVGAIIDECVLGVCVKAGAAAGLEFETYVLPYLKADFNPGTFDAAVTYQPTVKYQFGGLGVDFFNLETDAGFDESKAEFIVHAPSIKLETGLNISADLNLFAEACLFGCFLDKTYNLASVDFALPLIEIDTLNATARVFAPPTNAIALTELLVDLAQNPPDSFEQLADSVLYQDASAAFGLIKETVWNDYKDDLENGSAADKERLKDIEKAEDLIAKTPVKVKFSNPFTSDEEGTWSEGEVASAEIGGKLLDVKLDVDKVIGYALGLPNGATLSLDDFNIKNSPVDVEVTLFNIEAGPTIDLKTELTLSPELMVDIEFSAPVLIKGEIGLQTSYQGTWENIPDIALLAPETAQDLGVYANGGKVTATPTFSVDAKVTNRTYLDVAAELTIDGPSATVGIEGFGELNIDPGLRYEIKSDSIAQVDIYNETFNTGEWDSPTDALRNEGATRVGEAGVTSNLGTSELLSFDPSGEIVFQARSKIRDDDVAKNDNRVQQFLTSKKLIAAETELRGYEDTAFEDVDINAPKIYNVTDNNVIFAIERQYKINVGQNAQVMTDGQLKINQGDSTYLVVGTGGSLELGVKNYYGSSSGALSAGDNYGLQNDNLMVVDGDVYMAVDALAGNEIDRYKFTNNTLMVVGTDGSLKLDGKLDNAGYISSKGSIELTGNDNTSSGQISNQYGGEIDLYGNLAISKAKVDGSSALHNNGLVTVRTGGEFAFIASHSATTQNTNNGELIIEQGGHLTLEPKSVSASGSVVLNNTHIIDNSGIITNHSGQEIINGSSGANWSIFRDETDVISLARSERNTGYFQSLKTGLAANQENIRAAAIIENSKRQAFVTASGQFINNGKTYVESNLNGLRAAYDSATDTARQAQIDYDSALNTFLNPSSDDLYNYHIMDVNYALWDACLFLCGDRPQTSGEFKIAQLTAATAQRNTAVGLASNWKNSLQILTSQLTTSYQANNSSNVKSKEKSYGDALRQSTKIQGVSYDIFDDISDVLNAEAAKGLGVLVNRKDAVLLNEGKLTNHSVLLNSTGADLYNDAGAEINNDGGYLRNSGLLVNQADAKITNTGVIDNGSDAFRNTFGILDMAQLINLGELTNQGELVNNDTLVNYGEINNEIGSNTLVPAAIVNSGIMSNLGQINNDATLTNNSGSEIINHSEIVNNGTITNEGVFNNGQNPTDLDGDIFSVSDVLNDAKIFYRDKQTLRAIDNELSQLDEQIKDSETRESLVKLQVVPLLPLVEIPENATFAQFLLLNTRNQTNSLINSFLNINNNLLEGIYNVSLAAAQGKTAVLVGTRNVANTERFNASARISNLASVSNKIYKDTDGNDIQGAAYINLAAVMSANTANLENNGTFNNKGLFNNIATITNSENGVIRNSGMLMNGEQGTITNAGELLIEEVLITATDVKGVEYSYEQSGVLISNGTINNLGIMEIQTGTLVNGTLENSVALINNSGDIKLSASAREELDSDGNEVLVYSTANFINQGILQNQAGGLIKIGNYSALVEEKGIHSINSFVNVGQVNNTRGAAIKNNGLLANAGTIANESGSNFFNEGVLNNTDTGKITFADATTLGGDVINNGLITMNDSQILTLTGNISGNGTFAGNTSIKGDIDADGNYTASVNPGNSPGLLTFNGNIEAENVNWIMEIWGTERGVGYDAIDINGDFTLLGDISLTILSLLDFDTLISQEFNLFSITGDLISAAGTTISTSFKFLDFSDEMGDNWAGEWLKDASGWSLNLAFTADDASFTDIYADIRSPEALARVQRVTTSVPEPSTLVMFMIALIALLSRKGTHAKAQVSSSSHN